MHPVRGSLKKAASLRTAVLFLVALSAASCTVRLAADYDEEIDRAATALQQDMDAHLTELEAIGSGAAAEYEASEAFYRNYGVRLRSVRLRAQGHPKNELTVQQLDRMADSVEELRRRHEEGGTLSPAFISATRELFNTGWAAVIGWEIAKKRGA